MAGKTVPKPASRSPRQSADSRREELIEAAIKEFARGGLYGTPVSAITDAVGVTQPYAFSLFKTKKALFIAAAESCFDRLEGIFSAAAETATPELIAALGSAEGIFCGAPGASTVESIGLLRIIGRSYDELLEDADALRFQMQIYAAAGSDAEVREIATRRYRQVMDLVAELSGADQSSVREFLATGMLCNLSMVLEIAELAPARIPLD